ncbi:putative salt-induced outer membrane protein [Vibrio crassostreae]|nr:putative salt-induced outer membrane protein [Vibrio crassostreae]ROO65535.1 putative salt-induced outer membrane protein [Vibrio crassostreae]ROO69567.1 putative salt-induced outer membrane protein [Vibrio crassostreae]ROO71108.1 putative salt-induced outer membrane protein [Vibrio crassostreae]ROR64110.1 putative salt-induced outer membrane protein [Vibrio crassostreae]
MSTHAISQTTRPLTNTVSYTRYLGKLPLALIAFSMPIFGKEAGEEVEEVEVEDQVVLSEGAELQEEAKESPFTTLTKLGFIYSQNTSSSLSINSGISIGYKKENWGQRVQFDTYYTDAENDEDGTNRYTTNYGISYDLNEVTYLVATTRFEHDHFGTYRKQFIVATGLGRHFYDTERIKLQGSAGPGYRISKRQSSDEEFPNKENYELIVNASIDGSLTLTETFSMGATANMAYGEENTNYNLKGYLKNILMGNLALTFDTEYIYNTTVASDQSNAEIYSSMNLNYDF